MQRPATIFFVAIAAVATIIGCAHAGEREGLTVALYPWVPDASAMNNAVAEHWKQRHPDVPLTFVEDWNKWDGGYDLTPHESVDVFEIDTLLIEYFVRNGFAGRLGPSEIEGLGDFLPFARRASMVDGQYYAVPRIACTNLLIYREGNAAIEAATSLNDLYAAIGSTPDADGQGEPLPGPPMGEGLLIDLSGGTTSACFYLDTLADQTGRFARTQNLPTETALDLLLTGRLDRLADMAGPRFATLDAWGKRVEWFEEGRGRALVGFSERLYYLSDQTHSSVRVRDLPLGPSNAKNLFYTDALMISPLLHSERRELALEFINMCASTEVVLDAFLTRSGEHNQPSYLLPVRTSVWDSPRLVREAPLYRELRPVLENAEPFVLSAEAREWFDITGDDIQEGIGK